MIVPHKFRGDVGSYGAQAFKINVNVIIDDDVLDKTLYFSTNAHYFAGINWAPLLKSIPRLVESLDYESHNFKISNATIAVINTPYEGKAFSDHLRNTSFIGARVSVLFQSASAEELADCLQIYSGVVRRVTHDKENISLDVEDVTQQKMSTLVPRHFVDNHPSIRLNDRGKSIPMVYGKVDKAPTVMSTYRRVIADHRETKLVVPPVNIDPDYTGIGDSSYYQGHPFWSKIEGWGQWGTSKGVSPVIVASGDSYGHVPIKTLGGCVLEDSAPDRMWEDSQGNDIEENESGIIQWSEYDGTTGKGGIQFINNDLYRSNVLETTAFSKPGDITCHYRVHNSTNYVNPRLRQEEGEDVVHNGWNTPNRFYETFHEHVTDGQYITSSMEDINFDLTPSQYWSYDYYSAYGSSTRIMQGLLKIVIECEPPFSHVGYNYDIQLGINGFALPPLSADYTNEANMAFILPQVSNSIWDDFISATGSMPGYLHDQMTIQANTNYVPPGNYLIAHLGQPLNTVFNTTRTSSFKELFRYPDLEGLEESEGILPEVQYMGLAHPSTYIDENPPQDYLTQMDIYFTTNWAPPGNVSNQYDKAVPYIHLWNNVESNYTYEIAFGICGAQLHNTTSQHYTKLEGEYSEIDILHLALMEDIRDSSYYLNLTGRRYDDVLLENPIAVLRDLAIHEMGFDISDIDNNSYLNAIATNNNISLAFSVTEQVEVKELFNKISTFTNCYPHIRNDGKLCFPTIRDDYNFIDFDGNLAPDEEDEEQWEQPPISSLIAQSDVVKYNYNKTSPEKVYTKVRIKYKIDYESNQYLEHIQEESISDLDNYIAYPFKMDEYFLAYNGYEDEDDNVLELQCPYIRDKSSALQIAYSKFRRHCTPHLRVNLTLPITYSHLDIGDIVHFDKLIGGQTAFGADYTKFENPIKEYMVREVPNFDMDTIPNPLDFMTGDTTLDPFFLIEDWGRWHIPYFSVVKINRGIDNVQLELQQLITTATAPEYQEYNWSGYHGQMTNYICVNSEDFGPTQRKQARWLWNSTWGITQAPTYMGLTVFYGSDYNIYDFIELDFPFYSHPNFWSRMCFYEMNMELATSLILELLYEGQDWYEMDDEDHHELEAQAAEEAVEHVATVNDEWSGFYRCFNPSTFKIESYPIYGEGGEEVDKINFQVETYDDFIPNNFTEVNNLTRNFTAMQIRARMYTIQPSIVCTNPNWPTVLNTYVSAPGSLGHNYFEHAWALRNVEEEDGQPLRMEWVYEGSYNVGDYTGEGFNEGPFGGEGFPPMTWSAENDGTNRAITVYQKNNQGTWIVYGEQDIFGDGVELDDIYGHPGPYEVDMPSWWHSTYNYLVNRSQLYTICYYPPFAVSGMQRVNTPNPWDELYEQQAYSNLPNRFSLRKGIAEISEANQAFLNKSTISHKNLPSSSSREDTMTDVNEVDVVKSVLTVLGLDLGGTKDTERRRLTDESSSKYR